MEKRIASKLGFWASVIGVVLGAGYFIVVAISFSTEGVSAIPSPLVQLVGGIDTFISAQFLLVIFTCLHYVTDGEKKVFSSLGVSFIILFCATVSINRFVQLTLIQPTLPDVPADLTRFTPYDPDSVMFALEILGWGFFSSVAALCVAPLFSSSRLNNAIRLLFVLYSLLSFGSVYSIISKTTIPTGPIAWGPISSILLILLAVYFRKLEKQAQ